MTTIAKSFSQNTSSPSSINRVKPFSLAGAKRTAQNCGDSRFSPRFFLQAPTQQKRRWVHLAPMTYQALTPLFATSMPPLGFLSSQHGSQLSSAATTNLGLVSRLKMRQNIAPLLMKLSKAILLNQDKVFDPPSPNKSQLKPQLAASSPRSSSPTWPRHTIQPRLSSLLPPRTWVLFPQAFKRSSYLGRAYFKTLHRRYWPISSSISQWQSVHHDCLPL